MENTHEVYGRDGRAVRVVSRTEDLGGGAAVWYSAQVEGWNVSERSLEAMQARVTSIVGAGK